MTNVQNVLNSNCEVFLIVFHNINGKYFTTQEQLGSFLSSKKNLYLKDIKRFNPTKDSFLKVSKKELSQLLSWETEAIEELRRRNFIK